METLVENEEAIAKEKVNPTSNDDFEDHDEFEGMDGDSEEEFEKTKAALTKFNKGREAKGDNFDDDIEDDGDDDDSDYEFNGGDMDLYDSKLDELDELEFMKTTVEVLH